jgi:hypothetical protein
MGALRIHYTLQARVGVVIRYMLLVTGVCAATVAVSSAIWGIWAAAAGWGIVAVLHLVGAAVFELRHRRHERERMLRLVCEQVWARRNAENSGFRPTEAGAPEWPVSLRSFRSTATSATRIGKSPKGWESV